MDRQDVLEVEFDGKKFIVARPTNKIKKDSDTYHAKAYRKAIADGFFLNIDIDRILEERGFSPKEYKAKRHKITQDIRLLEAKLAKGEYKNEADGKRLAIEIADKRDELTMMDSPRNELESMTVDRKAENARFSYFAAQCIRNEDGSAVWNNFEEFEDDDSDLALQLAGELLKMIYNLNDQSQKDFQSQRTEARWLKQHGFMNDDLQLIDDKGRLIDSDGRLINDKGEFINEEGHRVDIFGNLLDDDGNLLFIDNKAKTTSGTKKKITNKKKPVTAPTAKST